MKRIFKYICALAVLPFAALSCDVYTFTQEELESIAISTDAAVYALEDSNSGDVVISLSSASAWTAEVSPATSLDNVDNVTITPASGMGSDKPVKVTVHFGTNAGYDRAALVSFYSDNGSCAATISQPGQEGGRIITATVTELLNAPVDASIYYEVTGVITAITNEKYNDFNLSDGENEILVYGLYNGKGGAALDYNWLTDNGISAGWTVTIGTVRGVYNGTPEALNAYLIGDPIPPQNPSIALGLESYEASASGEVFDLPVTSNKVTWTLSSDVDWLHFEPATADASTTVKVTVDAGEGGTGTITLSADGLESKTCTVIRSDTVILTCEAFNALPDNDGHNYQVSGIVSGLPDDETDNAIKYGNFYITDATGTVYVYGFLTEKGGATASSAVKTLGIKNGDYLTVTGPKTSYNGTNEGKNMWYNSHIESLTVAEFIAKEDGTTPYVLSGTVANDTKSAYGNFDIVDATGSVYVYGLYKDYTANPREKVYESLGIKDGDVVTLFGPKTTYNGKIEVNGSTYVMHTEGGDEPDPDVPGDAVTSIAAINALAEAASVDFTAVLKDAVVTYVNGNNAFIEDATGGIQLYKSGHSLTAGQKINGTVTGSVKLYNGYAEATALDITAATVTDGATIPVTTLKLSELLANYDKYINMRVLLKGVTVTDALAIGDRNGKATQGTDEIALYAQVKDKIELAADSYGDLISYPTRYNENLQLGVWENEFFTAKELPADITTIAGINALAEASEVEFAATLTDAIVTYVNGNNAFIEDATGGIQLYKSGHGLKAGQKINGNVSGKVKLYNGYSEATALDVTAAEVTEGAEIPLTTLTLSALLADYDKYINMRVKLEDITITDAISGSDRNGKATQGSDEIALYAQVKNTLEYAEGSKGDLISYPTRYNANLQLGVWENDDFLVKSPLTKISQINALATSTEAEFTATLTDAIVTYVNGNNAFIEDATGGIQLYKSGHGLVAGQKINGEVTGKVKLYNGYAEATALDVTAATVTEGAEIPLTTLTLADLLANYDKYINMRVKLEDITVTDALTTSDRNGKCTQGDSEIALYAQVKNTIEIAEGSKGDLISYPTRYNANLQLGVWDNADFTAK